MQTFVQQTGLLAQLLWNGKQHSAHNLQSIVSLVVTKEQEYPDAYTTSNTCSNTLSQYSASSALARSAPGFHKRVCVGSAWQVAMMRMLS